MNFYSKNTAPLTLDHIIDAATDLGCEPAAILTVSDVEARVGAFFKDGRPTILFEAHVFSKYTDHEYDLTHPDISSPRWNKLLYGASGSHQYDRLARAMALDEKAALMACSWGKYQIMGFNHKLCGYDTVYGFVQSMIDGEKYHLDAFCIYISKNKHALEGLQNKDWELFAEYYNGPGQITFYAGEMAKEYPHSVAKVQTFLGVTDDGIWGPLSRKALEEFVEAKNKPATILPEIPVPPLPAQIIPFPAKSVEAPSFWQKVFSKFRR